MTTLDFSKTIDEGKIDMVGLPVEHRADCKCGQFKLGKDTMIGNALVMEPITAKLKEAQLFKYRFQGWAEIIFVNDAGLVSSILIKGESLKNFFMLFQKVATQRKKLCELKITAKMAERMNEYGKYYAITFEEAGPGKYAEQIKGFAGSLPVGIFRLDEIPENTGVGYNNSGNGNNGGNGNVNGTQHGGLVPYYGNVPENNVTYALRRQ